MQRVMGLILALTLEQGLSANILGVFVHPTRSNAQFVHAVMGALANAGHNVTVYSPYKPSPHCGFHHVHVLTDYHNSDSSIDTLTYDQYIRKFSRSGFSSRMLRLVSHPKSESFLSHTLVQDLLKSNDTFDLVLTGAPFGEESLLVFGHKFRAPTISLLPMNTWSAVDYTAGNDVSLAFAPEYYAFPFTDRMSLAERVLNVLSGTANLLWNHWYDLPKHDAILQRHASWLSPPPVEQMVRDVALTFVNVHPTVAYPKPMPPNFVLVGGIHIEEDSPPLTQQIQNIMDSSKEGVIFCSLGSIVPVDTMPPHLIKAFINAFSKLPQKVIWKISSKSLPQLPKNIVVSSWLPQQRILEHPNLKLFFTHGGLGSQLEVLRAGVPVVGLPFMTDQPHNVRLFESLGVGIGLEINKLTEETITSALRTVLNNKSYAENARRVARIYADRPMKPADLVVYWTEYIMRHGGTHLRPQAALMTWYQRGLLDVAILVILGLAVFIVVIISFIKYGLKCIVCAVKLRNIKYKIT